MKSAVFIESAASFPACEDIHHGREISGNSGLPSFVIPPTAYGAGGVKRAGMKITGGESLYPRKTRRRGRLPRFVTPPTNDASVFVERTTMVGACGNCR